MTGEEETPSSTHSRKRPHSEVEQDYESAGVANNQETRLNTSADFETNGTLSASSSGKELGTPPRCV